MKRFFILLLITIVGITSAEAQSIARQRTKLAERTTEGNFVSIAEEQSAAQAISAVEAQTKPSKVSGYRVVIYFNNGQYAGDKAQSALSSFRSKYPHINAYLVYESPYFKVSVGDCLSMEEAIILMNTINGDYPKAFPKREDISLQQLQNVRKSNHTEAADTTALQYPATTIITE